MRVAKNKFLVEVDDQFVRPVIGGLKLFVDTDFNPKRLATKIGRIHSLPVALDQEYRYDNKFNVGDVVVFSHLVCQDKNKFADNIFYCNYHNIYAKVVNDSLVPIEDIIFCEKMYDAGMEIGCFKVDPKVSDKYAKVFEVSKFAEEEGVQKGDIVFFTKNADYEVDVCGKSLYKMHLRNIIGIERDGELKTFRNKLLVKNITKLKNVGQVERLYADTHLQTGVVLESGKTSIAKGTELTYLNTISTVVKWKGEEYSFINLENIKFII